MAVGRKHFVEDLLGTSQAKHLDCEGLTLSLVGGGTWNGVRPVRGSAEEACGHRGDRYVWAEPSSGRAGRPALGVKAEATCTCAIANEAFQPMNDN